MTFDIRSRRLRGGLVGALLAARVVCAEPGGPDAAALLRKAEASPAAPDAAVCLRTAIRCARGPEAVRIQDRAFELLVANHPASPQLVEVLRRLEWGEPVHARQSIARAVGAPISDAARATAELALARIAMRALYCGSAPAAAENAEIAHHLASALDLFRTVRDQPAIQRVERAQFELAHLMPGCPAPEIEGKDLEGRPMKLSDFRGKVVLISFWGDW